MKSRPKSHRKFWLKVHLYIGLAAGAVLVLVGLTGSIIVFHLKFDELLNPPSY